MKTTKHASRQAQKRGIEDKLSELVLEYGDDFKAGRNCRIFRISRTEAKFLKTECPPMLWRRYRDKLLKVASVVDRADDTLITTMHRYRPLWKRFGHRDR